MLALTGKARRWEPKRLRLRLFSVAGRLASSGRRLRLRSPNDGPGQGNHRRGHPAAGHPTPLTSRNHPCGTEGAPRGQWNPRPPARQPGIRHSRAPKNQHQPNRLGHHAKPRKIEVSVAMLPGAIIAVDLFHVVQLAVKTTGDVRRRAIRELYGRRGKAGDPNTGSSTWWRRTWRTCPAGNSGRSSKRSMPPARSAHRAGLDRQGETPPCPQRLRPRHRLGPVRAASPRPVLSLLRLVRA